jgi:hypothetical protein
MKRIKRNNEESSEYLKRSLTLMAYVIITPTRSSNTGYHSNIYHGLRVCHRV